MFWVTGTAGEIADMSGGLCGWQVCITEEITIAPIPDQRFAESPPELSGVAAQLYRYLARRVTGRRLDELPELPVPSEFRSLFRDWAEARVNFVEILGKVSS